MLHKLQRKTLVPTQMFGYTLTLFIGVTIILVSVQLFWDLKPMLFDGSAIFKSKSAVVSKLVNLFQK